ncbi:Predicted metal-dependent hydrolase, TIM-barrel fold [Streptomyces misionensis]|uniref:6-methylsalicylate decarboxylase n=1 Tax=Streptomyces misionensis TaxID=67331 RepID=A0A1H5HP92_9ACTN|nr:amidohydrolase family protein [Streptomyces misionensis]SEE29635.1 Predicted metal-dependent hydrolase, TIM-barrel fold [Streptomyces misionensis]
MTRDLPASTPARATGAARPGLIDVHGHFVTDSYVRRARAAGHERPDGVPAWPTWSAEAHLEVMDRSGIDTAVLSVSSPGVFFGDAAAARALAREVNEEGARIVRDHPGRFGLFASLPLPDVDGALAEIAYAFDELGADGVILESNTHGVYLGDPRLEPVFAELGRRQAVVFLHPTSPVCWEQSALGRPRPMVEFIFDTARTVTDLLFAGTLERHPGLNVVVPHCGGALPVLADRINGFMKLFMQAGTPAPDAVAQLRRLHYDLAGPAFPRQVPALLELADPERLLYGSDYCWTPAPAAEAHAASFDAAPSPVDGTTWRTLTTSNARTLLPRLGR